MKKIKLLKQLVLLSAVALFLVACGGGSNPAPSETGSNIQPTPNPGSTPNSGDWNTMIWGDGTWG